MRHPTHFAFRIVMRTNYGRQQLAGGCIRASCEALPKSHSSSAHELAARFRVPTANQKWLTATANRLILAPDERSLQVDLVRLDRAVPLAGCVGSRKPCTSASAQRAPAQMPEESGPQQHRPAAVCWALSPGSRGPGSFENHKARDTDALAPSWFSSLLALEIPTARWPAEDSGGHSPPHPRDERRKPALGRTPDTRRTGSADRTHDRLGRTDWAGLP